MSWGGTRRPTSPRTDKQQKCDYCGFKKQKDDLEVQVSSPFPPYFVVGWMCENCRRERGGDM